VPRLVDARDGWRWWRRCPDAGAPPVVASFHIPKLWGFAPAVVVTMALWCGPSPGERLVRVVRFMLAHGRVVVTMRHGWER